MCKEIEKNKLQVNNNEIQGPTLITNNESQENITDNLCISISVTHEY